MSLMQDNEDNNLWLIYKSWSKSHTKKHVFIMNITDVNITYVFLLYENLGKLG